MPLPQSIFDSRIGWPEWGLQSADILEEIAKTLASCSINGIRLITYWEHYYKINIAKARENTDLIGEVNSSRIKLFWWFMYSSWECYQNEWRFIGLPSLRCKNSNEEE